MQLHPCLCGGSRRHTKLQASTVQRPPCTALLLQQHPAFSAGQCVLFLQLACMHVYACPISSVLWLLLDARCCVLPQMKQFYHANYSSNLMCLSVTGKQSLDDLEQLVRDQFRAVPNSNLDAPHISGACPGVASHNAIHCFLDCHAAM